MFVASQCSNQMHHWGLFAVRTVVFTWQSDNDHVGTMNGISDEM